MITHWKSYVQKMRKYSSWLYIWRTELSPATLGHFLLGRKKNSSFKNASTLWFSYLLVGKARSNVDFILYFQYLCTTVRAKWKYWSKVGAKLLFGKIYADKMYWRNEWWSASNGEISLVSCQFRQQITRKQNWEIPSVCRCGCDVLRPNIKEFW